MLFSQKFKITRDKNDDWFDPILKKDTKLFIDPFLIFEMESGDFKDSYKKTITFFNNAFTIAATSKKDKKDIRYKQLLRMMYFPEVEEICLGYASRSTGGAGSGGGYSKAIVDSLFESIDLGIQNFNFFEEIGLFNEGFGCDRISDMTATLLKKEFIEYTQKICKKHSIPTEKIKIMQYSYNFRFNKWDDKEVELPLNPFSKKAVILVPKYFLRELPSISSDEFWSYCWDNKNEEIREQYSIEIKSRVNKSDLIKIARENRQWILEYETYIKKNGSKPYDIEKDSKGYYQWAKETSDYTAKNHLKIKNAKSSTEFQNFVSEVISSFTNYVENNSGYKLLWNDNNRPKSEEATQLLFFGIVFHYCIANDIDLNREVNLGRGPVDFKFSSGYSNKALIEVKLAKNSKFWSGLEKQLVKYLAVEKMKEGYFIVICYTESDLKKVSGIQNIVNAMNKKLSLKIKCFIIDATNSKPSASKL